MVSERTRTTIAVIVVAVVALLGAACSANGDGAITKAASDAATAATSSRQCLQLLADDRTTVAQAKTLLADMQSQVSDALAALDGMDPSEPRHRADVRAAVDRVATLIAAARVDVEAPPPSLLDDLAGAADDLAALSEGGGR